MLPAVASSPLHPANHHVGQGILPAVAICPLYPANPHVGQGMLPAVAGGQDLAACPTSGG